MEGRLWWENKMTNEVLCPHPYLQVPHTQTGSTYKNAVKNNAFLHVFIYLEDTHEKPNEGLR